MRTRVRKAAVETPAALAEPAPQASTESTERFTKMVGNLPGVLTVEAVAASYMPPEGQSGLPASLEQDVPSRYRYWKAGAHARSVRDALVEAGLFTQETVVKYQRDGENEQLRRVEKRLFLPDSQEDATTFTIQAPAAQYAATCLKFEADRATYVYENGQAPQLADLQKSKDAWLISCADDAVVLTELRKAQVVSIFKLATRPGLLFASNVELDPNLAPHAIPMVELSKAEQLREEGLSKIRLLKAAEKVQKEERFVLGVVLEPEVMDSQKDIYNEDEIRKAAHGYMEGYRSGNYVGIQHAGVDYTSKIFVLESYIAPADFQIPQVDGTVEKVKKGTWLMGFRVSDDTTWTKVKKGEITGLSIGGSAIRTPEKKLVAAA